MADKINRDRAKDTSIKTDDLNLGPIDDINLDFPGEGDEGLEFGKSRKPANPKKEFAIEFAKGLGGGVKSATATELRKVMPNGAAIVSDIGATFDDIRALKEDLSRQLGPMATTLEGATRKLLPKAEKLLPKKFYEKAKKKLDERAAARTPYNGPSKEQMESDQIANELRDLFTAQTESTMADIKDRKQDLMVDRAMGSFRHRQQVQHLTHLYDSVRATELFHKTQHMAYMKKSLELKYRHIFIARDTFNLLQQSMKTFEGYYKGILANTALPDMVKTKIGDYHRKNRTEKYGNMMSEALSNIRGKIMDKIKTSVKGVVDQAGFLTDMIGMGADQADMMDQMGAGKGLVPNLLGKAVGFLGGSPIAKKMLGKLAPFTGTLDTSLGGMKANAAVKMSELREKWSMSDNFFKNMMADFMPDTFAQSAAASNDLLTKGKDAVPFDVITRQSITEIIPGYLGKILHEVTKIQTGDANVEEQTFNVYERRFTGVSTLKQDIYDRAFGDEKTRRTQLNKTLALMQAGVARNRPDKDANDVFKGYEKDINRFFLNHAQYGVVFKPDKLREYLATANNDDTYINKVCQGFENNPAFVIEALCSALFDEGGEIDKQARDDIQTAITENYRKFDQYKLVLADANETYGLKQHLVSKMDGQAEKRLRSLMDAGGVAKTRMSFAKTDEQKAKYEQQIKDAETARQQLEADAGLFMSSQDDVKLNMREIVNRRNDLDFGSVDANEEDWTRRKAYEKYQRFDRGADLMHQRGMKYGGKLANALGAHAHTQMREYGDVFNLDESLKNSGKPEEKKGYKGNLTDTLKTMGVPTSLGGIKDKILGTAQTVAGAAGSTVEKLSPEVKKQFSEAKAKVASLKKQFEGTETGKKVLEQLSNLESLYDSAAKQGDTAIQYLKDEGAFDDPTGFLKKMYGSGAAAVKGWTESLPSVTDTEGWKDLLQQKKDDAVRFAQEKAEALKASGVGAKLSGIKGQIKGKLTEALSSLKDKAKEGLRDAGIELPGPVAPTPAGGGATPPPPPPIAPIVDNVVEPETVGSPDVVDRLDKIFGVVSEWKTEATENQGTIFDAVVQVDDDIKKLKGGIGIAGSNLNEEELAKQLGKDIRKNSILRRGLHAGKEAVFGTARGLGKMYTGVYSAALKGAGTAAKGIGYAAGNAIKAGYKAAAGVGKWLTSKEDYVDVYVKGKEGGMPVVSARKQKDPDEGIFYKSSGKRVMHSRDIDEPCVDKRGQLVITEEDLKAGLVMNNSTPIGKIGAGALSIAKGYFSVYGKALTAIGGVAKTIAKGLFGSGIERWQDVYRKDEVGKGPLVTARKQKEEGVFFFESGKRVDKTSDIHEPICDKDKKILISKEDIEHGLVNVDNKPLGSGGGGGIIGALARGVAGALPGLGKFAGKAGSTLMGIYGKGYKGLMDLGFGALKGAGKFLGRALGLDISGIGGAGDKETKDAIVGSHSMLKLIQADVALMAAQYKEEKNPLDKDGDGDIDGSYADQMQNKKGGDAKRLDAKDLHKDVNWLKDEKEEGGGGKGKEDGGGIFDMLGKFLPKKWKDKLGSLKNAFGKKAMSFAKGAGNWMLKGGRALMSGAGSLFSKSLPYLAKAGGALKGVGGAALTGAKALGAKALPALGTAGKAALGAGKFLGGKAALLGAKALPMMGSALGSAGSAIGGLASAAGPALMAAAPWLAGAAAVAGAGYLGYKALGIGGLIKGIKGNDNPLTEKEIEKGRTKLQRKIDKGLPGYDRILQEYEKAVSAQNWRRARELSGQEADGIIKSMWKESWIGKGVSGIGNFLFGKKDEEMTPEEIEKTRAKFNSIMKKGGSAGKNAEKLLSKFEDYVAEQDWKNARKIAGAEKRGLFGKLFQDSKGNVQWGKVIGLAAGGLVGYGIGALFTKADVNKPMTEEEVKKARERLQKLADGGNKAASKILDQFDEAVTEQNWKKARKLVGEEVQSNLSKLGGALKSTAKWTTRIATLGLSTLFESDQDKPMSDEEIKKFTDKMNFLIEKKNDKLAKKKLEKFEEAVAAQKWDKARQIAKMPHKSMMTRAVKATASFFFGDDEKEMTEQEMTKFRESMQRKISMGSKTAQKKLDAFEDAVGAQRWKRARIIAGAPDDGIVQKGAKALGKGIANQFRFFFGGDGKPMSETEIEQARKEMGWAISDGKKGAQKRLDLFNDYVADEKWEKARKLAKMPYENVLKRAGKAIGGFLFGDDKEALSPEEIDKFQKECEQRVADGDGKAQKILDQFNSAVESENWKKARALSGLKNKGLLGSVTKGAKKVWDWFAGNSDYEDCQKIREELEEKAMDDETGLIQKGLEDFEKLVRRQKYNEAIYMAKDLLKMKPSELTKKYKLKSEAYDELIKQGQDLTDKIDKKIEAEKGWFSLNRMRLKSLRSDLIGDQESWSQEFFDDIQERLSSITGEDQFADIDKPDDDVIKKGESLIKDIETSQGNYSWLGSPIIKTQLANLKSEVQGDMTAWCDETINTWKKRLKAIDKDYKGADEQEDYEKGVTPDTSSDFEVKEGSPFKPEGKEGNETSLEKFQARTQPQYHDPFEDDEEDEDEDFSFSTRKSGTKIAGEEYIPGQLSAKQNAVMNISRAMGNTYARGGFVNKFADGGYVVGDNAKGLYAKAIKTAISFAKKHRKLHKDDINAESKWSLKSFLAFVDNMLAEADISEDDYEGITSVSEMVYRDVWEYGKPYKTQDLIDEYGSASGSGESGFGLWDHVVGAGKGVARLAASPVTGLYDAGKGVVTGDFNRDEYDASDETMTEKIVSAPGKAISNGLGWIGKGIGSLFAKGGFVQKFAGGGFAKSNRDEVAKYEQLCEDLDNDKDLSEEDTYRALYYRYAAEGKPFKRPTEDDVIAVYGNADKKNFLKLLNLCRHAYGVGAWAMDHYDEAYGEKEDEGFGLWDHIKGAGVGLARTAASPVTGLWNAGKGTATGDFNRDEYGEEDETMTEKIVSAPGKAISNGLGWIGKGIGSLFARGGFTNKFADGGFTRGEVEQYDKLVEDLEADKDLSPEDTYRATYYDDGLSGKPFKKPTEDDVKQVYGSSSKKDYLRLLNLARHAYKLGQWVTEHPEIYDEDEQHVGGVLNPMNWFASGGFATSETPAIDADGKPLVYGEAGTEAIMPIRSKPGNLLSRVGSKLGDILSGKPTGPMNDGAGKASVHAGTDESEPMENMMANELAKTVRSRYRRGGFAKFAEGGFVDNMKNRAATLGMTALNAALGPIFDTLFAAAIIAIAPAAFAMLGPAVITLVEMVSTVEAAEAWEKGDYLKCAGFMLLGGAAPAVVIAFFGLLGVGGALMGATFMTAAAVGEAMGLLRGINKGLLPEACQEYVNNAIDSIGTVYSAITGAALGTAATPLTATWNLGKAAITGDFERSEYVREGESALATALNAPHRAIDNAAGWAGKGIHAVGKGIGSMLGFGGSEEEPKNKEFSEESIRNMIVKKDGVSGFASGGFVRDLSLVQQPSKFVSGAADLVSTGVNAVKSIPSPMDRLTGAIGSLKTSLTSPATTPAQGAGGDVMAKKLAEASEVNKQLLELLQSIVSTNGIKVSGLDELTQVCALSGTSGGGASPQPSSVQVIQAPADDPQRGLDLRKRQM